MNQILITEKLYITPELKRKKSIYKISFILSILLIFVLFSFYVYAQYDRNKSEELSQDILASMMEKSNEYDDTVISENDSNWRVNLQVSDEEIYYSRKSVVAASFEKSKIDVETIIGSDGKEYKTVGSVKIPSIDVEYPILLDCTDKLLKVSVCKFWGANPNEIGNLCIAGHNYRSTKFFSKVPTLENGDIIEITDLNKRTIKYKVYSKYTVDPNDKACTSQLTNGKRIVTLITCTNDNKNRVIVKAEAVQS